MFIKLRPFKASFVYCVQELSISRSLPRSFAISPFVKKPRKTNSVQQGPSHSADKKFRAFTILKEPATGL
jgi:hypothetical protein